MQQSEVEEHIDQKCHRCSCNIESYEFPILCSFLREGWDDPNESEELEEAIRKCPGPFHSKALGIDLHGVLDAHPEILRPVLRALHLLEIRIYIISGPSSDQIVKQLADLKFQKGVHYTGVASVVDFLKMHHVPMWQDSKDDWWTEDLPWNQAKASICAALEVDVLIDDCKAYEEFFAETATKFILTEKLKKTKPTS